VICTLSICCGDTKTPHMKSNHLDEAIEKAISTVSAAIRKPWEKVVAPTLHQKFLKCHVLN